MPAARQTLALLQALARQPGPVPAAALARELGLPRSTTYHLLAEMVAAGFVVHLPEERRYGLGVSAFEIGSAYARQEPLARRPARCSPGWSTRSASRRTWRCCTAARCSTSSSSAPRAGRRW
ncbi:helix-turn-helix domain-containing protein [Geodermatophilus sp. URMC 62]|uniref:helix-turn-helix domain-containing protein n=1 Tax=Geodermatophilus sp. URMC 62 TaxID=3423414 RepID=UPI00406D2EB6